MNIPDLALVGIGWFFGAASTILVILIMRRKMMGEALAAAMGIQKMMQGMTDEDEDEDEEIHEDEDALEDQQ